MTKRYIIVLFLVLCSSCSGIEEKGNIYGVVTAFETAEPMRAAGVSLYYNQTLLLRTVTYDDGHFEFSDLTPDRYNLKVEMNGFECVEETVLVEAARTARADVQMKKESTGLEVTTYDIRVSDGHGDYSYLYFKGRVSYPHRRDGMVPVEKGFVVGKESHPTIEKCLSITQSHNYESYGDLWEVFTATGYTILQKGEQYYCRAYARNQIGVAYGEDKELIVSE